MVSRAFGPLKGLRLLFGGCEVIVHGRPEGTPLQAFGLRSIDGDLRALSG